MDDDFNEFIEHIYINLEVPRIVLRDMENPLERFSNNELIQRYRFGRNVINNILLPIVYPEGMAQTNRGLPIPPVIKLCTALRFYASGSHQNMWGLGAY